MNVNYHYTNLGAVPGVADRSVERRDAMLARTGPAARAILKQIRKLPGSQQVAALDRVLANFDPELPMRVRRVAEHLRREGMSVNASIERALALSLADATISRIQKIGRAYRNGELTPVGYLGQTPPTSPAATTAEQNAGDVVARMFQGVVCSDGLQRSVSEMVGRNEGREAHDATNMGYEVAQGFAQCASLTPAAPAPLPPPAQPESSSLAVPIAIGLGAVVVTGGILWYTTRTTN